MSKREGILIWVVVLVSVFAIIIDFKLRPQKSPYKGKYIGATAEIMKRLDKLGNK